MVLDRVVEQSRDGLVFVASVFEHERRDCEQVREVGDLGALSKLAGVQGSCERHGLVEPLRENLTLRTQLSRDPTESNSTPLTVRARTTASVAGSAPRTRASAA